MEPDFSGYATKADLKCSDGRIIKSEAFQHMDGKTVPLVWQHGHNNADNVLGHVKLESRTDGVYARGFFNATPNGQHAKAAVQHGDLDSLSIYANQLREHNKIVHSGSIREVSLVLTGANPGAKIDYVRLQHSADPDDVTELDDEAVIHTGENLERPQDEKKDTKDSSPSKPVQVDTTEKDAKPVEETVKKADSQDDVKHADGGDETGEDVYESLTDKQKSLVHFMIGAALEEAKAEKAAQHSDDSKTDEGALAHKEGTEMSRNVFEQGASGAGEKQTHVLSHSDVKGIVHRASQLGSLKGAVDEYAIKHGIENIDILFPDARNVSGAPEMEKRRTEWVADVLANVRKLPFSRIKTFAGDLTQDEARAKGYIKGNYKKEQWFGVTKRTTTPTTIYKKQKLDRDDMLDITDFDVVAWLKAELRLMTEEEFARAVLIGDGRDVEDEDKVADPQGASDGKGIRSIANDHELFVTTLHVNVDDADSDYEEVVDRVMDGMEYYKGTGTPTFYTTVRHLNKFKKAKDQMGRRYYETNAAVAEALGVKKIVTVEAMQNQEPDIIGIVVNLDDYSVGTDKGGELTMFDDFDLDYNQYKYLMETRSSGALTKPKSALVIRKTAANSVLVAPTKPTFNASTGVITIPNVTGVDYKDSEDNTLTAGAQTALTPGQSKTIYAQAKSGYHFADTVNDSWIFKRPAA